MRIIFPIAMAIGFQANDREWFDIVRSDAAALHISSFAIQSFIDRVLRHQEQCESPAAMTHFQKGVSLLRERLLGDDEATKVSDATIGVVLKLASAALFNGHYEDAKQHIAGLWKMVDLRGGLDAFQGKYLLVEMLRSVVFEIMASKRNMLSACRIDLTIAVLDRSKPVFFSNSFEPLIPYPEKLLPFDEDASAYQESAKLISDMDHNLATAWLVMKRFCLMINLGAQSERSICPTLIYKTMAAVTYRLLRMRFAKSSDHEALRYGLLAYCYHVFLQWQDIKPPYHYFVADYQECLANLELVDGLSDQLRTWLLMMGAISVFTMSDETWLRQDLHEYAAKCQARTWAKMQDILKSFMWIPLLDETSGKQIHNSFQFEKDNS